MNAGPVLAWVALQVAAPSAASLPDRAVRELVALRAGVTADGWLGAHPADAFAPFAPALTRENHDRWCARASVTDAGASGAGFVRYAYFYPPTPPPSLALPGAGGPGLVRAQCVLGAVWVEASVPDTGSGTALALRVRELLTRAHGPVQAEADVVARIRPDSLNRMMARLPGAEALRLGLHFFGAAGWRVPGRWQVDSAIVVSAFDAGLRAAPRRSGRVLAFAFLPLAELGSFRWTVDAALARQRTTAAVARQAARLSGAPPGSVERLLALLPVGDSADQRSAGRPDERDVTPVRVLGDWLATARRLDAPHRAAALLAADQVLAGGPLAFVDAQGTDSAARQALEALGARFARDELGGGYNYAHSWLDEARRLAPSGPVGNLATLVLLRMGFNETGTCSGGTEAFRQVTAEGERLLGSLADSAIAAEVHLLVGDAYADIVGLATGLGHGYADTAAYRAEAGAARASAIAHYRASLALDPTARAARRAWLEAWRLLAGLPPTTTHFFCVYD